MNINAISPLTTLYICRGVPLDSTYTDTLRFTSVQNQINYFAGRAKITENDHGEIKLKNTIRVPYNANELYDCNYVVFRSNAFNGKWFFAFIKDINYASVASSHIVFEIDVMQTWFFDMNINRCLVEREHSNTDNIGDNLVYEPFDIGDYISEVPEKTEHFAQYSIVICIVAPPDYLHDMFIFNNSGYIGGLFTGAGYVGIEMNFNNLTGFENSLTNIDTALRMIENAGQGDNIIAVIQMPSAFVETQSISVSARVRSDATLEKEYIGAYRPRNKKLLCYPYNFLYTHDGGGGSAIYRYEYFDSNSTCGFFLDCGMSPDPEIILAPIGYNGSSVNWDEKLTMKGFPQCAYAIDTFRAWLAQKGTATALSALGSTAAIIGGAASGNAMVAFGGALGLANSINSVVVAAAQPPQTKGHQGNSTMVANLAKNFYFVNKHITEEYARILDDYFTRYGYQTNRVKTPNITGRPVFNYVKTQQANITGNISFDDLAKIKSIFDSGVTFWHNPANVGRYDLSNQP